MGQRENNFGLIRLLGAFLVIAGHMYTLAGDPRVPMAFWSTVNSVGVAVFFTIGGYLITLSWVRDPDFKRYMVKRVFRIFPAFIACIFVTALVIGPLATNLPLREYFGSLGTWNYLRNCYFSIQFSLPGVFMQNPASGAVNGSIWCLPVEFVMYLVVPVYISIGNKMGLAAKKWVYGICTAGIMIAGTVWTTWFYETHIIILGMDLSQVMNVIPYYFIGIFIALCRLEGVLNVQVAVVVTLFSSIFSYLPVPYSQMGQFLCIPYVILSLALAEKPVFARCRLFRTGTLPDISYGMFLFSFVVQQFLIQICITRNIPLNIWALLALSVFVSAVFGVLAEQCIEKPAASLCKKILKKM